MLIRWIMRRWALAALWFRFRKKQMVFHAPPPLDQGAILAGNHQAGRQMGQPDGGLGLIDTLPART